MFFRLSISGQSVSPPFPALCPLDRQILKCGRLTDSPCKRGYTCRNGICCLDYPPRCPPGHISGPLCVPCSGPFCPPNQCPLGFTCINGRCCIPPTCPAGYISGQLCPTGRCPTGFTCIKGRCCKPLKCPAGYISGPLCPPCSGPFCPLPRCPVGFNCMRSRCCKRQIIDLPRCPRGLLYMGKCFPEGPWGFCRFGSCINGACCLPAARPFGKSFSIY